LARIGIEAGALAVVVLATVGFAAGGLMTSE
jgi:hypothetical protein